MRTVILVAMLALAAPAWAQTNVSKKAAYGASKIGNTDILGVGLYLGRASGITAKYWLGPDLAATGLFGSWLSPFNGGALSAGMVYHLRDIAPGIKPFELGFHFGGAAGVGWLTEIDRHEHFEPFRHEHRHELTRVLAFMQPIAGMHLLFREISIEIFAEVAPAIRFTPGFGLDPAGGMGGRYHF